MFENWTPQNISNVLVQTGTFLGILLASFLLAKFVRMLMNKKSTFEHIDKTLYQFMVHFTRGFIYFIGIILAIYSVPALHGLATPLFAGSGVLAIIIGFASQHAFSNIMGGIFIAVFRPFRIGDRIKFLEKDFIGVVEDITLRHTIIRTFDNKRIIVPNSVISQEVVVNENIFESKTVRYFDIGISYDSDIDKAINIIKDEALKHPKTIDNRSEEAKEANEEVVTVRVIGFGESSVNLRGFIWTSSPSDAYILGCDLNKSVKERFDREGIEIPFPYRNIIYKKPQTRKRSEGRSRKQPQMKIETPTDTNSPDSDIK